MSSASRIRNQLVAASMTLVGAVMCCGVVASPALAGNPSHFGINGGGNVLNAPSVGYPAPGGIYAPFTDCPLNNHVMEGSVSGLATGCIASVNTSGTFTINGIPVAIKHPVTVQFGVWDPPSAQTNPACNGNQFCGGTVMPADGKSLVDSPETTPGGLPLLLLCPGSTPDIAALCQKATTSGQTGLTALVRPAGPITNFGLVSFTQPVKIQLINPLLGGDCYIGSDSNPIVLNPTITSGTLAFVPDPNPARFPTTVILEILNAQASDNTFSVPVATGCGPGGDADAQINGILGLPSPSGKNSLVLNGNSYFADDFSQANQVDSLKAAFKASSGPNPAG
jgi:hypothetical protein